MSPTTKWETSLCNGVVARLAVRLSHRHLNVLLKSHRHRIPWWTWCLLCWQGDQTLLFQPSQCLAGATVVRCPRCAENME
jgi:hypothetical protein